MTTLHDVLRGTSAIAADATLGLIDVVEQMHATIGARPEALGSARRRSAPGLAGTVYRTLRGATRTLARGSDAGMGALGALLPDRQPGPRLDAFVGVLNGISGDHLVETGNALAIQMQLRQGGRALDWAVRPAAGYSGKALVLVHGLCLTDLRWRRDGHDHGQALAQDGGYTPLYLRYNSGLHVSVNGRQLAALLEDLVGRWPVPLEEVAIIGHSMGGLVARSACHYGRLAGHSWLRRLRHLVFLGTPHHGTPLERGGNRLDLLLELSPYSAPITRLGRVRSAGITDLRYGDLRDEDWLGRDRFERGNDRRQPVPLPDGARCYAVAAVLGKRRGSIRDRLVGDGLVPLDSALGRHARPELALPVPASRQWIAHGTGHLELLASRAVYERVVGWLVPEPAR